MAVAAVMAAAKGAAVIEAAATRVGEIAAAEMAAERVGVAAETGVAAAARVVAGAAVVVPGTVVVATAWASPLSPPPPSPPLWALLPASRPPSPLSPPPLPPRVNPPGLTPCTAWAPSGIPLRASPGSAVAADAAESSGFTCTGGGRGLR